MKRSIVATGIATVVVVSTGAGWIAATRVKSPAKLAAEAAPPAASLITYPVERRILSSNLIIRGTMRYSDPISVVLAPSALRPPPVLVSQPPVKGTTLNEGDVALVVSGRPVFVLKGVTPGYRDLGPGTVGADVKQLEEFLQSAGFNPGTVDDLFDSGTAAAVTNWYAKAGFQSFGPNDQQRGALRLTQTALSQATDRLLQAKQAELVNRSGAKPADVIDARAGIDAAKAAVAVAKNAASRDAARGRADLTIKEADLLNRSADVTTKEAVAEAATITLDDVRRRDALIASGVNVATGVALTPEQLVLLQDGLREAKASVSAAEADLTASETIATSIRLSGEASVADARVKLSAASTFVVDGLTPQEQLNAITAARTAQTAVALADANATRDNSVAAADVTTKKALLAAAKSRVAQAQQRIDTAKTGVDPSTGIQVATPGDRASSQLAVKQAELALRQAQLALPPARAVLAAAQGDVDALRRASELTAKVNQQAIADAELRVRSSESRLLALGRPGVGAKTLSETVAVAQAEVDRLQTELQKITATIGVQVPANELVFLPSLPLRIDDTKVKRGDPVTAEVMTVSGTRLAVDAALLTSEAPLTNVGATATIEAPEYAYSSRGTITFVADKPGLRGTDAQHIAIEVAPEDSSTQLVGASVRITIPTRTTNGEALVVPVNALSMRADGSTQLQIEGSPGSVRTVIVTAGLSAQGFVEIIPLKGSVQAGDRVVIGTDGPTSTEAPTPGLTPTGSAPPEAGPSNPPTTVGGSLSTGTPTPPKDPLVFDPPIGALGGSLLPVAPTPPKEALVFDPPIGALGADGTTAPANPV